MSQKSKGRTQTRSVHTLICSECRYYFQAVRSDATTCGAACRQAKKRTLKQQTLHKRKYRKPKRRK